MQTAGRLWVDYTSDHATVGLAIPFETGDLVQGSPEETLIVQTARLLGYDRTGALVTARLKEAITDLEKAGAVTWNDVLVTKGAPSGKLS